MNKSRKLVKKQIDTDEVMKQLKEKNDAFINGLMRALCGCGKTNKAMFYRCDKCGNKLLIWLERGLEEHNGDFHKPVPFTTRCPRCNDLMKHIDWHNDISLREDTDIPNNSFYFANIADEKCGIKKYKE